MDTDFESRNQNNSFNLDPFRDSHRLRIHSEYCRTQCVGGAKEVKIERDILIIRGDSLEREIRIGIANSSAALDLCFNPQIKCNSPIFCELRMKFCTLMWHPYSGKETTFSAIQTFDLDDCFRNL